MRSITIPSTGDKILAFGLTEPEAGSNPLEMQMTYRRDGDRFLLNGVDTVTGCSTVAGEHQLPVSNLADKAKRLLPLAQTAESRTQIALDATVIKTMPPFAPNDARTDLLA